MPAFHKRLTRKDLRQPDQFVTLSGRVVKAVQANQSLALIGLAVLLVAFLGAWGWEAYRENQNTLAAQEFSKAVNLYHSGRLREAVAAFEKLDTYRWSLHSGLAILYQANSYLALNEVDKAIAAARRYVQNSGGEPLFKQIGLVTLGHSQERKSQCKEAIQSYAEAEKLSGAFREQALLGRARCQAAIGDGKAAVESYRQYIKDFPGGPAATDISLKISELEAKVGNIVK